MKRLWIIAAFALLLNPAYLLSQETITASRRISGPPAGTTPTVTSVGNLVNTTGFSGNMGLGSITAGQTIFIIASVSGTLTATDNSSPPNTYTCLSPHTYLGASMSVCSAVADQTATVTATLTMSSGALNMFAIGYVVTCSATCVIDQGPTYADTASTGALGTALGGSITTTHQLHELILGGFSVNIYPATTNAGPWVAQGSFAFRGSAGCSSGATCSQNTADGRGGSGVEDFGSSNIGTFVAGITEPVLNNTIGLTMAIR